MRKIFGKVVLAGETRTGTVVIDDAGRIAEITSGRAELDSSVDLDAEGYLILPGFIDQHIHGGGGADFMDGSAEAVRTITTAHARFGTTGLLATTITASRQATSRAISAIRDKTAGGRAVDEARILGIHLEGPYLCAKRCGAQPPEYIRKPDLAEFEEWVGLSSGLVRKITIAPEIAGAHALIKSAVSQDIIVSMGHTDALAADINAAVAIGASQATHLFNGMRGLHHREPGAAGALLSDPKVVVEIIADGIHLDPAIVRLVIAAKGPEGVILITDAMSGTAMPDGEFKLGGARVTVQNGMATLSDGTLAGSVLTMNKAFVNASRYAGLEPDAASRLASTNAAASLGLNRKYGAIEPGLHADLAIVAPDSGEVLATIIDGKDAYRR